MWVDGQTRRDSSSAFNLMHLHVIRQEWDLLDSNFSLCLRRREEAGFRLGGY